MSVNFTKILFILEGETNTTIIIYDKLVVAAICRSAYRQASKSIAINRIKYAVAAPVELTFNIKILQVNEKKITVLNLLAGSTGHT